MEKKLTEIERLDLAARAQVSEQILRYARVVMILLSLFFVYLAVTSEASFKETFAVRILAGYTVGVTILSWMRWRFALHAWAILFLMVAIGTAVLVGDDYLVESRRGEAEPIRCIFFFYMGYLLWPVATRFAVVYGDGWEHERAQVQQWLNVLRNLEAPRETLEFSMGSFWKGYRTCRLLNTGHYWAIAKFKTGDFRRLTNFRIREPNAVRFEQQRDGKMKILIANRPA